MNHQLRDPASTLLSYCQLNFSSFCICFDYLTSCFWQSDSEYMAGQLSAFGYALSDNPDEADLWMINTWDLFPFIFSVFILVFGLRLEIRKILLNFYFVRWYICMARNEYLLRGLGLMTCVFSGTLHLFHLHHLIGDCIFLSI